MFWDLIATVAAAFAVGGALLLLRRHLPALLPKWIIPFAAGAAMIGYVVWAEYSWYPRVTGALPQSVAIATRNRESSWWRPWTYLAPMTTRFIAVDREALRTHPLEPDQRLAEVLLVQRWQGTVAVPVLYDCAQPRRADLVDGAEFASDGTVLDAVWVRIPQDDPVRRVVCGGG